MSATEQQVLEDYETDKSAKRYKEECIKKLLPMPLLQSMAVV